MSRSIPSSTRKNLPSFGRRSDPTFAWASGPRVKPWREAFAQWTAQHHSRVVAVRVGNVVLDRVAAMGAAAPSVSDYCKRSYACPTPVHTTSRKGRNGVAFTRSVFAFFEWYLDTHLSSTDAQGRALRSRQHWNPVPAVASSPSASETARDALPVRLIRRLFEFLTADDWKWARSMTSDWVDVVDSETGETVRVWCPVRASALALKLLLPLRTFQIRMLESTEGDAERYVNGRWVPNTGPHAPSGALAANRRGFLRAFRDRLGGGVYTGFFVNTNKTASNVANQSAVGYEIPWQHDRAIAIVEQLERWHDRYNPVEAPMPWASIHESRIRLSYSNRTDSAFLLMRDPLGTHPNDPITDGRIHALWDALMAAVEDDLAHRGERLPNGDSIVLTDSRARRRTKTTTGKSWLAQRRVALHDLHSLRVSLLTALAVEGGVPLHVLSKCVAGHASLVMTLYYLKTDTATVNRAMQEAAAKIDATDRVGFLRYLQSKTRSADGYVADPAAIAALDGHSPVAWQMMETGICPVGGTRCGDGGPPIGKKLFGPVPGGRNCVRCRFHVSGPAFLPGIVAKFNACSMRVERARAHLAAAQRLMLLVEDKQYDAESSGEPGDPAALTRARDRFEEASAALDSESGTLQELAVLAERCKEVLRKSDGTRPSLILRSEKHVLDTEIRKTSSFALYDAVCQASALYPDEVVPEARMHRNAAIDRMLVRSGRAPMMLHLPDDVGMAVANELTRLMVAQLGEDRAFEVITEERATLEGDVARLVDRTLDRLSLTPMLEGPK